MVFICRGKKAESFNNRTIFQHSKRCVIGKSHFIIRGKLLLRALLKLVKTILILCMMTILFVSNTFDSNAFSWYLYKLTSVHSRDSKYPNKVLDIIYWNLYKAVGFFTLVNIVDTPLCPIPSMRIGLNWFL